MTDEKLAPNLRSNKKKSGEIQRLMLVMGHFGFELFDFANKCAVSERTLKNHIYEDKPIGGALLRSIHLNLGVSIDWLISGRGLMLLSGKVADERPDYSVTDDLSGFGNELANWRGAATDEEWNWLQIEIARLIHQNWPPVIRRG